MMANLLGRSIIRSASMRADEEVASSIFFAHESVRESQQEMIVDGISALKEKRFLLAAAPTGIGKTAAALASALEVSKNTHDFLYEPKIIFMTGRQSQHKIVVDTVRQINSKIPDGFPKIKMVDIIGRESMCEHIDRSTGKCSCEEDIVEESRKNRRSDLREKMLEEPRHVGWGIEYGRQRKICAWATARSAVKHADILVCDYNHVFIEEVRESSLPVMGIELENSILIVDEAHNLPDRIRKGLERRVTNHVFRRALSDVQEYKGNLEESARQLDTHEIHGLEDAKILEKQVEALSKDRGLKKWFSEKQEELENSKKDDIRVETAEFLDIISRTIEGIANGNGALGDSLIKSMCNSLQQVRIEGDESLETEDEDKNDCLRLAEILRICMKYRNDPALALVFDTIGDERRITSHLLDPGVVGGPIFEKTSGSILMSGTLFPPSMYSDILGLPENRADGVEYKSGFPPENRPILIASDVTSKFSERESSYSTIRDHISSVLEKTPGNVAIFAPSYVMMDRIDSDISYSFGKRIERESRGMPKNLVERMINGLYERKSMGAGTALLGVLRGKFSEGIDYSENVLDAVVCVGLPLPPPSARQEALLDYYTKRFRSRSKAWKYASLQPAVNSILQALGRPIRKAEDRAIIILLEKRLLERQNKNCMPLKSMQIMQSSSPSRTSKLVERFFEMN
ncbi:MAG: hypothetical protein CND01_04515 [Marine Group II euryarchaeote MED-G34]|nr:MAG: hypothetical protein CND01_04515 [Marine Group II euryarchaeote MED-G34]